MQSQPVKPENIFSLYYSYYLEYLTARFYRNIFNFICFVQMILGSAFMANIASGMIAGFFITLLSAYIFVYKPGEVSSQAKKQSIQYENLMLKIETMDIVTFNKEMMSINKDDSFIPDVLRNIAYTKADIALNGANIRTQTAIKEFDLFEKISMLISGCRMK
ncbi:MULTISPECIES: hypothetical protein [Proteus]|uniref:hypothetical protein n=1 Tax=Proteus TaxID=583 RepID=UPI001598F19A|nr:hypothetical protein [Proteus columbae]QKJ48285.1 hypothetical protein G9394_05665 [Proteus vulgaris]